MSAHEVQLGLSSEGPSLRLFAPERHQNRSVEYFSVEIGDGSASARLRVYAYDAWQLAALFESMAREWRGWLGEKVWYSPEREFDLRATSDGRGHVTLKICVVPQVPSPPWRFECTVPLEAGQLDRVAVEIRSFVEGTG
jgi:hypothetical protein